PHQRGPRAAGRVSDARPICARTEPNLLTGLRHADRALQADPNYTSLRRRAPWLCLRGANASVTEGVEVAFVGSKCPAGLLDCSGLMPAKLMTLPPFSISLAMSLPKSAGEPASTVPPRSASRALVFGSARPALISLLSLSTISAGVLLGAPTP